MPKNDYTREAAPSESRDYLAKAQEFQVAAESSLVSGRWNAAGLDAIHAGISAADAAVIASSGLRSSSKDHSAAVGLLNDAVAEVTASQTRQLTGLLGMKNTVEYERRLVTEPEARTLVQHSSRLVRWAEGVVRARLGDA